MSDKTGIEWTDATWNPIVGCDHVSAGCDHCYAATLHNRRYLAYKRGTFPTAPAQYHQPFWGTAGGVQLMPARLGDPLHWRKPRRVFVNSMSDLFHEQVPDEFIARVFTVMRQAYRHTFQILTKRPERMRDFCQRLAWYTPTQAERDAGAWGYQACLMGSDFQPPSDPLPNVWLGVSVEHQAAADERIPLLLETPAAVRFLSCEPLLGEIDLREYIQLTDTNVWGYGDGEGGEGERTWGYEPYGGGFQSVHESHDIYDPQPGIHWVIVGGESGPRARRMAWHWLYGLLRQCRYADIPIFAKQMGTYWAKFHGLKDRHGGDPTEWPESARIRQYPGETAEGGA